MGFGIGRALKKAGRAIDRAKRKPFEEAKRVVRKVGKETGRLGDKIAKNDVVGNKIFGKSYTKHLGNVTASALMGGGAGGGYLADYYDERRAGRSKSDALKGTTRNLGRSAAVIATYGVGNYLNAARAGAGAAAGGSVGSGAGAASTTFGGLSAGTKSALIAAGGAAAGQIGSAALQPKIPQVGQSETLAIPDIDDEAVARARRRRAAVSRGGGRAGTILTSGGSIG